MNKAFYPIHKYKKRPQYFLVKEEVPRYIKIWAYNDYTKRHSGELSEIITGTNLVLEESLSRKLNLLILKGNTEQTQLSGKNLFDGTYSVEGKYLNENGGEGIQSNFNISNFVEVKPNTSYTLSSSSTSLGGVAAIGQYDGDGNFIIGSPYNNNSKITILTKNNCTKVKFSYKNDESNYQFEEGSQATSYEPYCGGIPSPNPDFLQQIKNVTGNANVKIQNKNLFDESIFKQYDTKEDDEAYKMYNSQVYNKDLTPNISFKENTSYTLMYEAKQSSGNPRLAINYDDGTIAECPNTAMSINYTQYMLVTPSNKKIKNISFKYGGTGYVYIKKNSVMVLEGAYTSETIPSYVPHQEQNYPFTFAEGQRAMQGTQLLDDGIHNNRNRVNLWEQTIVNGMAFGNYYRYQIDISDARTYSTNVGSTALCNCFYMDIDALSSADAKIGMFVQFRDTQGFYFISDKSTTTEFIAELTENNAVLEYELAEEEIIPYNETQQEQYNAMKQAISYNDITYIETSSDELQPTLDVQYWKKKTE